MDLNKFKETYLRVINEETQTEGLSIADTIKLDDLLANSIAQAEDLSSLSSSLSSTVSNLIEVYRDKVEEMNQDEIDNYSYGINDFFENIGTMYKIIGTMYNSALAEFNNIPTEAKESEK